MHRMKRGATSCGTTHLPLHQVVAKGRMEWQRRLEGSGCSAMVLLEAEYKPYF